MCAFKKFNINLTEWRATAAESRTLNQPCSKFWSHFYDDHDVWHFFSAVALFFFFMVRASPQQFGLFHILKAIFSFLGLTDH